MGEDVLELARRENEEAISRLTVPRSFREFHADSFDLLIQNPLYLLGITYGSENR